MAWVHPHRGVSQPLGWPSGGRQRKEQKMSEYPWLFEHELDGQMHKFMVMDETDAEVWLESDDGRIWRMAPWEGA
jgi:hypothetical protein